MNSDNILLSAAADLYTLCEKRGCPVFSHFYDGGEQAVLSDNRMVTSEAVLFGGHESCERKMLGVFPYWEEPDRQAFPIRLVRISCSFKKDFSHRDYLGSLMGLGIERDRIGDILVTEGDAFVFIHESVADYVLMNLRKIGSHGVKLTPVEAADFEFPEGKFVTVKAIAASLRLDAVVAAGLGISRSKAAALVDHEKVSINHRPIADMSARVSEGDLFSVRGFGRFIIESVSGETRSGRLHLTVKKYL
ncbi:MAG: hypothetical protein IJ300_11035 [Clostridia bacterium]|nr:hypothetical protein [Clostridia bacterium]